MNKTLELKAKAEEAKYKYHNGIIDYEIMVAVCKRYIDEANKRGAEISKEHGMKHRKISLSGYMR
jgi:hypothetical protein